LRSWTVTSTNGGAASHISRATSRDPAFTLHLILRAGFDTFLFGRFERDLIDRRNITDAQCQRCPLLQEGTRSSASAPCTAGQSRLVDLVFFFRAARNTGDGVE